MVEVILTAYRLAKYYSRPPGEFLAMPLMELERHAWWTDYLIETAEAKRPRHSNGG
jgi:hypothetical protein